MKAVFRVDSSNFIGFGHLTRCLTLARVLRRKGAQCTFICRDHPGNMAAKVTESGFSLFLLEDTKESHLVKGSDQEYDRWLGCSWQADAEETNQILRMIKPNWMIVDHYSIDVNWERVLSKNYENLLVIDDIANRYHSCDVLLDQNLFLDMKNRYEGRVSQKCLQLLGPKYALIQPEYSELREQAVSRNWATKNILIFFGGADQSNLTELAVLAAHSFESELSSINVVMPSTSPYYHRVKKLMAPMARAKLHTDLPSLAKLVLEADIGIGAGGAANWERFCLGLPTLVITLAKNQISVNNDLSKLRLIELIGDVQTIEIERVRAAIGAILRRRDLADWSRRCMQECSGDGAIRVADILLGIEN